MSHFALPAGIGTNRFNIVESRALPFKSGGMSLEIKNGIFRRFLSLNPWINPGEEHGEEQSRETHCDAHR